VVINPAQVAVTFEGDHTARRTNSIFQHLGDIHEEKSPQCRGFPPVLSP